MASAPSKRWSITLSFPQTSEVSGVAVWATQLACALDATGHDVRLVVHAADATHPTSTSRLRPSGGKLQVISAPSLDDPSMRQALVHLYGGLLPTIWIPPVSKSCYAIAAALASVSPEQLRIAAWTHSDSAHDYAVLTYYEPIIHHITAISRKCLVELKQRMPTRATSISHLPHGVTPPSCEFKESLTGRPIRLLYAGRMEDAHKRVSDLILVAENLLQRGVLFEMRLVGDGPQKDLLQERIEKMQPQLLAAGCRIRLDAPLPHHAIEALWSWADVGLLTSSREGFSLAVLECMAGGCVPVVSAVTSGVEDIVHNGENGLIFPIGDVALAAGHIMSLSRNPSRWQALSCAARHTIHAQYTYDRFLKRVEHILHDMPTAPDRGWPLDRPMGITPPLSKSDPTVPADAADRLRQILKRISAEGLEPAAIFGAGHHTRTLATVLADSSVRIAAVLDDDERLYAHGLWGWATAPAQAASSLGVRSVVISSWLHEEEIWRRHAPILEAAGIRVFRLYGGQGAQFSSAKKALIQSSVTGLKHPFKSLSARSR